MESHPAAAGAGARTAGGGGTAEVLASTAITRLPGAAWPGAAAAAIDASEPGAGQSPARGSLGERAVRPASELMDEVGMVPGSDKPVS